MEFVNYSYGYIFKKKTQKPFKCNNCANAKNSLCKRVNNFVNNAEQKIILCKMLEIVYAENSE